MKQDKNTLYYFRILKCLLPGGLLTIRQIAHNVGLSEKTVRTRISQINLWLKEQDCGLIEKKQGIGIWLVADEAQKNRLAKFMDTEENLRAAVLPDNRNKQLIGILLRLDEGESVTIQQLADSLYLSPPTVAGILKEVAPWFAQHHLTPRSVRSRGVSLQGDEYSIRIAIADYMMEEPLQTMEPLFALFVPGVDVKRLRQIIVEAENAWRIELADESFKAVWFLTCLALARGSASHRLTVVTQDEKIQRYNEYSFAESIYQRVERDYGVKIAEEDVKFLAVHLLTAKKLGRFGDSGDTDIAQKYDQDLGRFVRLIIETIDSVLEIDLSQDELLYESLMLHMRSAVFRMKYSTVATGSISQYVKNEYKQTFIAAWATSNLFEEYYDVQVTEDELAGIALYIQAAILRQKRGQPITALIVGEGGMAAGQLSAEMLKYNIPELTEVYRTSHHDLRLSDWPQADVIVNMTGGQIADDRVVNIAEYVGESGIEAVRRKVNQIFYFRKKEDFAFDSLCHPLFEVDLFFMRPQVRTKDELIARMVGRLVEKGDVTENYLETVLARERATTTSIGRGIAIPHGSMAEVNESKIAVAVLPEPIIWHGDPVDIVFLLAVKMNSKFEIRRTKQFYKDFLKLTDSDDNLEAIKNMVSALDLYQYFIK